jgi:hypothetical protein
MHLVGYLNEDHHDARSFELKAKFEVFKAIVNSNSHHRLQGTGMSRLVDEIRSLRRKHSPAFGISTCT